MRVVTRGFVDVWRDRLINIHPSLLPSFPGLHTHARALAAGVKLHGCTVHFVREAVDALLLGVSTEELKQLDAASRQAAADIKDMVRMLDSQASRSRVE